VTGVQTCALPIWRLFIPDWFIQKIVEKPDLEA
jgi:hypothetical protein